MVSVLRRPAAADIVEPGNLSGNCLTMAPASGSAIIPMWAYAVRVAAKAFGWSPAAWASITSLRVSTWVFTSSATASFGRFGLAEARKAPKSCVYWTRSVTALSCFALSFVATPTV